MGLPRWCSGKESACQYRRCKRCEFDPWVKKILLEQEMATPLQYSYLENSMDRRAWRATVQGVTKCQTRLSTYTHKGHLHCCYAFNHLYSDPLKPTSSCLLVTPHFTWFTQLKRPAAELNFPH